MYSVVAHNADPYLELDTPVYFSNHRDALTYATETAITLRAAEDRRTVFTISGPEGSLEYPIELLCSPLHRSVVALVLSSSS
jgi:hypothetical protein